MVQRAVHDRGGWPTETPIDRSEHELADWELLTDALVGALGRRGLMNVDELRRGIESMPPAEYERASYYERWLYSVETILTEKGVLAAGELDARLGREVSRRPAGAGRGPAARGPSPHPGYVKGKIGSVERVHASFTNPETRAYGADGLPKQPLYLVGFAQRDVWPDYRGHGRRPDLRRRLRALAGGSGMSEHDHDHPHAPITNGDEPAAAARVRALEELLVEKGVIGREDVRQRIDWLVSRSPADGARLVARAWVDPEFKERLLADARAAALELGLDPGPSPVVVAVENTQAVHHMVVCTLCSCYPRALLGPPPDWYKSLPYRSRAVSDPRGVLNEFGVELDDDVELRVLDSTADIRYLVIPRRPAGSERLSEEELAALVTRDSMIGVAQPAAPAQVAS